MTLLTGKFCNVYITSIFSILLCLVWSCSNNEIKQVQSTPERNDSTSFFLKKSIDKNILLSDRKKYLSYALETNSSQTNDSIKKEFYFKIIYQSYVFNDSIIFFKSNEQLNPILERNGKTGDLARANYYLGLFYKKNENLLIAYNRLNLAQDQFININNEFIAAVILYNMAAIQQDVKDYTGSEITTIEAIKLFAKINETTYLFNCYNLLGVVYNELEEYQKAIIYHRKAIVILKASSNDESLLEASLNNIGLVYQKNGDYQKAIEYFDKILSNTELEHQNINRFARVIDNRAYSKFMSGDTVNVFKDFKIALKIRDSVNNVSGIIASKRHLAEYHSFKQDTSTAITYLQEASSLATSVNNNRDKLSTLKMLSDLDTKNSKRYLDKYIALNDSLQIQERKLRNKFTRIRFETDEQIEENEKLSTEYLNFIIGSSFVIVLLGLFYLIKVQRSKNKALLFEKEQQKSNEEIYKLLLNQQSKIEEGRLKERNRISEELHDGVLGKIFGTRLSFGFLSLKGDDATLIKYDQLVTELQELEKEIRNISHELKSEIMASHQNFNTIVKELVHVQSEIGNFNYKVSYDKDINWNAIDGNIKINCYRIIQEALQNCNKHAKASELRIDFIRIKNLLKLTIKDNGVGFSKKKKMKGIGLKNIKSRSLKMNGEFNINSSKDSGTILTILIPV